MVDTLREIFTRHAQPVVIEWRDSHTQSGIVDVEDHGDYLMRSVGFQVAQDRNYLRLAQTLCGEGEGELLSIPLPCIIKRTWLTTVESEKEA